MDCAEGGGVLPAPESVPASLSVPSPSVPGPGASGSGVTGSEPVSGVAGLLVSWTAVSRGTVVDDDSAGAGEPGPGAADDGVVACPRPAPKTSSDRLVVFAGAIAIPPRFRASSPNRNSGPPPRPAGRSDAASGLGTGTAPGSSGVSSAGC
ncbi:hypothetical protein ACFS2C_27960 [Prauserella oleivorans]|uniref:Uncharacterized protein n=1 Tax=Prauserella oleivorans TaxID=1478153 RepID=A0ABW5WH48_9PSEU